MDIFYLILNLYFVFCRLAKFSLNYGWERIFQLLCSTCFLGYLPQDFLVSYEQGPSLRISGDHQNQTYHIYSVKASWSYLVVDFLDHFFPFLWIFNYLLKRSFSVLSLRARNWRILFGYEILGFHQGRKKFHVWSIQTLSLQFSFTVTKR